jgi:hypothetical protein
MSRAAATRCVCTHYFDSGISLPTRGKGCESAREWPVHDGRSLLQKGLLRSFDYRVTSTALGRNGERTRYNSYKGHYRTEISVAKVRC